MKKVAAMFISAVMIISCGSTAFAAIITHDIENDGDLTIGADGSSNTYVVTGTGTATSHRIVVNGASTTISLENVNIETNNQSAIDIGDDADVQLVVSGTNSLTVNNPVAADATAAGIHISGGSLTISGTDAVDDSLAVLNTGSNGAAIGSDNNEDFTGTITIDGGVTVNAGSPDGYADGAAIGSGKYGDMSGTITINDDSVVNASSQDYGAGIGSGESGIMSGDIIINGGDVTAYSDRYGAGIGAGDMGNSHLTGGMTGNITINDGTVNATSKNGIGIGTGDFGEMSGSITINGGDVTAVALDGDAAIGAGNYGGMSGSIIINGGNVDANSVSGSIGIGSHFVASGDITIHGDAEITLENHNAIGSSNESTGTIYIDKGTSINGITVTDIDELKDAGILNDNMNAELVDVGETYSLGKVNNVSRVKTAKAGDTVCIYESQLSKGKLPYYVLEALAKTDNVTLEIISDSGETVEIKSSSIPEKGKNAFFTVDELLEMTK